jgi:hypothetical protein
MHRVLFFLVLVLAAAGGVNGAQGSAGMAGGSISGNWLVNADIFGTPIYFRLELRDAAGKLTGRFGGDKLEGTITGNSIHFVAKGDEGREPWLLRTQLILRTPTDIRLRPACGHSDGRDRRSGMNLRQRRSTGSFRRQTSRC